MLTALLGSCVIALAITSVLAFRAIWSGYPPRTPGVPLLTAKEQAIVAAAADTLFPDGGAIPASGTQAGIVRYVGLSVARVPRETRLLLRLLFAFVEHGPWLFGPRRVRLTRMRPAERAVALGRMATSRLYFLRVAFASLRTLLAMGYMAHDPVARAVGCSMRSLGALARGLPCSGAGPAALGALSAPDVMTDASPEALEALNESGERPVVRPAAGGGLPGASLPGAPESVPEVA